MKDRDYLIWLHERLEHIHGENPLVDYMHKLRAIIAATPPERETLNCVSEGIEEIKRGTVIIDEVARWKPGCGPRS